MKAWNKNINSCWECVLFDRERDCHLATELFKHEINVKTDINPQCPFAQKITKEVIEGFGFTKLPEYFSASSAYILETDKLFFPYSRGYKINYLIESHSDNAFIIFKFRYIDNVRYEDLVAGSISIFMGTINNPIELEFILRSV